ncbi:hypothetical protein [Diplocloster hominis]|uniref:hypothetical protein n=1 Tax=Diplocloster hominis TaxID=3079010 RepID=UPI0031BB7199
MADKRDYKQGYRKHYRTYKRLQCENADLNSRRLLLVYSVECGLKYLLLNQWHEESPKNILFGDDEKKKNVLRTHNLEKILKELGQQGAFKFPQLLTIHKDYISIENYHQLYRYCIRIKEKYKFVELVYEEELRKIAIWIEEGM